MKTTKRLLTTIIVALLTVTASFADITKAECSKAEEYYFEQVQSIVYNNPFYIRFHQNEATALRISGVLHDKKPVTNEQLRAHNAINEKLRAWYNEYISEVQATQASWNDIVDAFVKGKAEPTNEQEAKAIVDELVQLTNKFFNDIGPVVEKYGKKLDKIEKMMRTYERM